MKDFFSTTRFKILVVIAALMIGFMIAAVYTQGSASFFSNLVSLITRPAQQLSASISDSTAEFFQKYSDNADLYEENEKLKQEVEELRNQLANYNDMKHENEQFRNIAGMMEQRDDLTLLPSFVLSREENNYYSLIIDQGSRNGVEYLDPVVSSDGSLIGYVSEVGYSSSRVSTILDIKVNVGSYESQTRETGTVTGSANYATDGYCVMEFLSRDSAIEPDGLVLTSGSGLFPRDLMIGTVVRLEPNPHGTETIAVIKPASDLRTLKDVFVITSFDEKGLGQLP